MQAALDPVYSGATGDMFITQNDGHGHVWNGSSWDDVGQIQGPAGPQGTSGTDGAQGVMGLQGSQGASGVDGVMDSKVFLDQMAQLARQVSKAKLVHKVPQVLLVHRVHKE